MPHLIGLDPELPPTPWKKRIRSVTWAWYTMAMGTGGLSFLFYELNSCYPKQYLITLGEIVYVVNLVFFVLITAALLTRFALYPRAIINSVLHPNESSFIPAFPLGLATLISTAADYGTRHTGYWFSKTVEVFFWIYVFLAVACCIFLPAIQWGRQSHPLESWQPQWILPPMCIVFAGTVAYSASQHLPAHISLYLLVTAYVLVGLGFFSSLIYHAGFVLRAMSSGLPPVKQSPLIFINTSPVAWSAFGILALGTAAQTAFPNASSEPFLMSPTSGEVFNISSTLICLLIYGYSYFWVFVPLVIFLYAVVIKRQVSLTLANWSLTFPNTGFVATTLQLGIRMDSRFLKDLGIVFFFIWLIGYFYALVTTILGLIKGEICAEGKDQNSPMLGFYGDYEKEKDEEGEA